MELNPLTRHDLNHIERFEFLGRVERTSLGVLTVPPNATHYHERNGDVIYLRKRSTESYNSLDDDPGCFIG